MAAGDDPADPVRAAEAKELERISKISEANRKIIAENNALLKDQLDILKELAEVKEKMQAKEKSALEDLQVAKDKLGAVPARPAGFGLEDIEITEARTAATLELKHAEEALNAVRDEMNMDEFIKNNEEYNNLLTEVRSNLKQNASAGADTGKMMKGSVEEIENMDAAVKNMSKTFEEADESAATLQKVFGKMTGMRGGVIGTAIETVQSLSRGLTEFGKQSQLAGGPVNLMKNSVTKLGGVTTFAAAGVFILAGAVLKLAFELDGAAKSLGSSTGMGNVFGSTILKVHENTALAGASMAEAAGAIGALADNFSAFNPGAEELNARLATTLVHLNKLGVDNASAAKSMDYFTRTLGMSGDEAAAATTRIATMGTTMGTTSKKMVSDFLAVQDRLSIFGKRGEAVFKDLAAQAKAMGLEVNTLTGVAAQFDTFDKAAESSAKLNAVLGTNLSTLQLLNMEDDERIHYLRQEINMSVGNFESLDKYTKMYIAQAMGVKSVREAQNLLNMSTAEYNKYLIDQEESMAAQEELADLTRDLVPIMTKLKTAFLKVVLALSPLIELMALLMDIFATVVGHPIVQFLLKIAAAVALIYFAIGPIMAGLIGIFMGGEIAAAIAAVVGGIMMLVSAFFFLYDAFAGVYYWLMKVTNGFGGLFDVTHKTGSKSMAGGLFEDMAEHLKYLANAARTAYDAMADLVRPFTDFFGITHKKGSPELYKIPETIGKGFESMGAGAESAGMGGLEKTLGFAANFDAGNLLSGVASVKSAVAELSNAVVDGGFIAIKTDGSATSMVAGSDDVIAKMADGKITVDVKMPEMKTPKIELHVQIDGEKLRAIIVEEIYREAGSKL